MVKKIELIMIALEHVPEPTMLQAMEVAKKFNCSERWVWEGVARLRKQKRDASIEINQLKDLTSNCLYLQWFMDTKLILKVEMRAVWKKRLNQISAELEDLRLEFNLDEKGVENKE